MFFLHAGFDTFVSDAVERRRASFAPFPQVYAEAPYFRTAKEAWEDTFRFGPEEYLVGVFAQLRSHARRDLRRFLDDHRAVHGHCKIGAAVRDRNDDLVGQQLRILHDFFPDLHHSIPVGRTMIPIRPKTRRYVLYLF